MTILLASTSTYRRKLMENLGLPFRSAAPLCDENTYKEREPSPAALARTLARAKAESLRAENPDALIVGSDQVVALGEWVFGKPGSHDAAAAQLTMLSGATHEVLTAVAVVHPHGVEEHLDIARLTMKELDEETIDAYLRADTPYDCAGSYKLESRGAELFERVESEDRSAITGLPMLWLERTLRFLTRHSV
jgi:septum formation protein